MNINGSAEGSPAIVALQKRFEKWREGCGKGRRRIPPKLWDAAAALAREQGLGGVSRALRLSQTDLKKRAYPSSKRSGGRSGTGFVEVDAEKVFGSPSSSVISMARPGRGEMMIRTADLRGIDLVSLVSTFWKSR